MAAITYFIDESGNTGDLINAGKAFEFGGQPLFALGCIGVHEQSSFNQGLEELKAKHGIKATELKASSIYKKKPLFIADLVRLIIEQRLPFFVEVVDKKYFLSTYIVNSLIYPPYFSEQPDESSRLVRMAFAQFICNSAPDSIFESYIECCKSPGEPSLLEAFRKMSDFADTSRDNDEFGGILFDAVAESLDDFECMKRAEGDAAYKRFIPVPDVGKSGKLVWILPNLSSLTNVYARINLLHGKSISGVNIIHDEHAHFDEILLLAKETAETISGANQLFTPSADYGFLEKADLSFMNSQVSLGLQAADVLTGFVSRYLLDNAYHQDECPVELHRAFQKLDSQSDTRTGIGINYVWQYIDLSSEIMAIQTKRP